MTARRWMGLAVAAVLLLGAAAPAQAEKTAKPRSQVEDVPGEYIQLETLWVPVLNAAGSPTYLGLVVRLWPGGETRYEACVKAPWVHEALLVYFNDHPLDRETYEDDTRLGRRITAVVDETAGSATFRKAKAFREFTPPDEASAMLSLTCR